MLSHLWNSASQIDSLVDTTPDFAIGLSDEIDDGDAIACAAQFYSPFTDEVRIGAANDLGRVRLLADGAAGLIFQVSPLC